ncbi:MAG: PSD1 domain-containing protein [Planctomycetaceae bacterium]|nr:PSD1 domain-containing protein [Planctomycetaceae bacterium]
MICPDSGRRWTGLLLLVFTLSIEDALCRRCEADENAPPAKPAASVDFDTVIRPILARRCYECHGPSAQESGLRLDRREPALRGGESGEPAVVPGKSDKSPLIARVTADKADAVMPPDGERLTAVQVNLLRTWIDQGAVWGKVDGAELAGRDLWSLKPIRRPAVPDDPTGWSANAIDCFILAGLAAKGLSPSPESDRRTLLRRLFLDVLGLPPTPEEIAAFIADETPDAWERQVDRVLTSPHYGERWGRHWLDVVRFAETDGFEMNQERPNAWRYRDWVIAALNADMPFERFARAQIAGDTMGEDVATGFLVGGAYDKVKSPDIVLTLMQRQDEFADVVNTTGTAFLGLTLGCARCHNHKFDPITQTDYYALQAVFAGVQHGERSLPALETTERRQQRDTIARELAAREAELRSLGVRPPVEPRQNEERFAPRTARFVRFRIHATNGGEPCLDELEIFTAGDNSKNVALASAGAKATASGSLAGFDIHKLEHLNDGRYGNGRSWISNTAGKGWVTLELRETATIDRIVWGRDREGKFKDRVPTEYDIEVAAVADQWVLVASSADRLPMNAATTGASANVPASDKAADVQAAYAVLQRIQQLRGELAALSAPAAMAYAGRFETPGTTHRLYRGDPMSKREAVGPDTIAARGSLKLPADAPESSRRAAFAGWLVRRDNPLAARVIVNRLWQSHFGRGLVATPSDFGKNGVPPTHPDLLDWLASDLGGLKAVHRLILTSNTYRQSSAPREDGLAADAGTQLLWRFPPRRLEAEVIRDSTLAVCGVLDTRMEGPGFSAFEPNANYVRVYNPKETMGPAEWRRMVYMTKIRMQNDGVFGAFDCPDAGQVAPLRTRSTTPLQALNLLNSGFAIQQSELFAKRIRRDVEARGEATPAATTSRAFVVAFGREPTAADATAGAAIVEQHGLPALCRALLNSNEFLFLP